MVLSPASFKLVGAFYWLKTMDASQLSPNHSELLNSDVGEQVGRVMIS